MLLALAAVDLVQAFQKSPGVSWRAQQMRGLLQRVEIGTGEQDGVTLAGRNLDRRAVVVDLLDERKEVLACVGSGDCHHAGRCPSTRSACRAARSTRILSPVTVCDGSARRSSNAAAASVRSQASTRSSRREPSRTSSFWLPNAPDESSRVAGRRTLARGHDRSMNPPYRARGPQTKPLGSAGKLAPRPTPDDVSAKPAPHSRCLSPMTKIS